MSNNDQLIKDIEYKSSNMLSGKEDLVSGLPELSNMLFAAFPADDNLVRMADERAQDSEVYFLDAYSDSRDMNTSIKTYLTTRDLIRYILLMDRHFEVGDVKNKERGEKMLKHVKAQTTGHIRYSIEHSVNKFWHFWSLENQTKQMMMNDAVFGMKEIRYHNQQKSSDAPIIYGSVLDNFLPNYNPNVSLVIHYNQALEDVYDDFLDIEEDVRDRMPNVFVMSSSNAIKFSEVSRRYKEAKDLVTRPEALKTISSMVDSYEAGVNGVDVPKSFGFLKTLSNHYIKTIRNTINQQ